MGDIDVERRQREKSIGRNIVANFAARVVVGATTLLLTPTYVSALGIDAYGIIGSFAALQAIFYIFDFGLGLTLNRYLAQLATDERTNRERMHDAVRTFEVAYWAIGVLLGASLISAAWSGLAASWFRQPSLSAGELSIALALMGMGLALQWPSLLYLGGLLGLQRQLSANLISALAAVVRGIGAVAVLRFVSPTLEAFFVWQIVASALQTLAVRARLSQILPAVPTAARVQLTVIRSNIRFAADITGITVLGTLLIQLDKVILSRTVPLTDFGYYVLAGTVASSVNLFVSPVFNAIFPRLAATAATRDQDSTRRLYHEGSQVMAVLIWPLSLVLIAFAPEVLIAWLGAVPNETTVWLVRILVAGTALNGLMNIPYALMLASGWSRLPLILNAAAVTILVPFILYMTLRFGTPGGATAWLLLNLGYVSVGITVMHRRLLVGDAGRWYRSDVGLPFLGALGSVALFRFAGFSLDRVGTIVILGICGASAVGGSVLASAYARSVAREWIRKRVLAA